MMQTPLFPNFKERNFGWRYLLFQTVFLSGLLYAVLTVLNLSLSAAAVNGLYFCLNAGVAILAFLGFWRQTLAASTRSVSRILITACAGLLIYRALALMIGLVILFIDPDFANVNDQSIASLSQEYFWLMAVGTVILAPIAEEVFHRGCVFGSLYRRSRVAAYAVSAAVFSIVHISGYVGFVSPMTLFLCFLQYLPAGVCLAAAYQISGSILTPIIIHSAVNAIAIFSMR